jgi:hypothetical protein
VKGEWYKSLYPQLDFAQDQDSKGHMDNTMQGSRQSTSVGGSLLGLGGDILIADDLNNTETRSWSRLAPIGPKSKASLTSCDRPVVMTQERDTVRSSASNSGPTWKT